MAPLPAAGTAPSPTSDTADNKTSAVRLQCALQDGRDFADVVSPKLPFIFDMAASNRYYLHIIQHLVEGDTGGWPARAAPAMRAVNPACCRDRAAAQGMHVFPPTIPA